MIRTLIFGVLAGTVITLSALFVGNYAFGSEDSLEREYYRGVYTICQRQMSKRPDVTEFCNLVITRAKYQLDFYNSMDTDGFRWPAKRLSAEEIQ